MTSEPKLTDIRNDMLGELERKYLRLSEQRFRFEFTWIRVKLLTCLEFTGSVYFSIFGVHRTRSATGADSWMVLANRTAFTKRFGLGATKSSTSEIQDKNVRC